MQLFPPLRAAEFRFFFATFDGRISFVGPLEPGSLDRCNTNLTSAGEFPGHFISGFDSGSGFGTYLGAHTFETTFCLGPASPLSPQGERSTSSQADSAAPAPV